MKKTLTLVTVCSLLVIVTLFQNCGKKSSGTSGEVDSLSVSEFSSSLKSTEGDSLDLVAPDTIVTEFLASGECGWDFTNNSGVSSPLNGHGTTYTIVGIKQEQAGTYVLTCSNETIQRIVTFRVSVKSKTVDSGSSSELGDYVLTLYVKNVVASAVTTKNITRANALANCLENAAKNLTKGIKCVWKTETIFERGEMADLNMYAIRSGQSVLLETIPKQYESVALGLCKTIALSYATEELDCKWGTKSIYTQSASNTKADLAIYAIRSGKAVLVQTVKAQYESVALTLCKSYASTNKTDELKCNWGTKTIYTRAAAPKATLVVKIVSTSLTVKTVSSLSEAEAGVECTKQAVLQSKAIVCTWGTKQIYKEK